MQRQQIAELALKERLPSMFSAQEHVEAGGLMSYGQNLSDLYRRAAGYVDNNAMVRTVNALWGTKKYAAPTQGGLSPLPDPRSYPSSYYKSVIQPVYPKYSTFGK